MSSTSERDGVHNGTWSYNSDHFVTVKKKKKKKVHFNYERLSFQQKYSEFWTPWEL